MHRNFHQHTYETKIDFKSYLEIFKKDHSIILHFLLVLAYKIHLTQYVFCYLRNKNNTKMHWNNKHVSLDRSSSFDYRRNCWHLKQFYNVKKRFCNIVLILQLGYDLFKATRKLQSILKTIVSLNSQSTKIWLDSSIFFWAPSYLSCYVSSNMHFFVLFY